MDAEKLQFQRFTGYGAKVSRKISITRSFSFGIPPTFFRENDLEQYSDVILFYDEVAMVIGIKFLKGTDKEKDEGSFKLIHYGAGKQAAASFSARSFFNQFNLDVVALKGRYTPEKIIKDGIGQMFVIDLKERQRSDSVSVSEN